MRAWRRSFGPCASGVCPNSAAAPARLESRFAPTGTAMAPKSNSHLKIWRDGQLVAWDDANIHIMSHVVHYGSSVFEGVRSYETSSGGAIFRAQDHMRRLVDSCRIYRMAFKYSADDM